VDNGREIACMPQGITPLVAAARLERCSQSGWTNIVRQLDATEFSFNRSNNGVIRSEDITLGQVVCV
jgi:hypothetical protein